MANLLCFVKFCEVVLNSHHTKKKQTPSIHPTVACQFLTPQGLNKNKKKTMPKKNGLLRWLLQRRNRLLSVGWGRLAGHGLGGCKKTAVVKANSLRRKISSSKKLCGGSPPPPRVFCFNWKQVQEGKTSHDSAEAVKGVCF